MDIDERMNHEPHLRAFQQAAGQQAVGRAGVLLDFDGTLSPIVARPELAKIRDGAREAIARLVGRYAVVAVVSGRTPAQLRELVGIEGVVLAGLYGLGEESGDLAMSLVIAVTDAAARVPGTRVERKGGSIAVHFRGADDPRAAEALLHGLLGPIAREAGLEVIGGKMVLELVPAGLPLKEGAVERIVDEAQLDAVLYAGDDLADVRAFAALDRLAASGAITVKVAVHGSETPSQLTDAADVVVDGPAGLVGLLRRL
jgi:trehalose 6-phosphate phosphatase